MVRMRPLSLDVCNAFVTHSAAAAAIRRQRRWFVLPLGSSEPRRTTTNTDWVACNVYITAGGDSNRHPPLIRQWLRLVQDAMLPASSSKNQGNHSGIYDRDRDGSSTLDPSSSGTESLECGVLVHAYTDPIYNRSSFHLAGSSQLVAKVATDLAVAVVKDLRCLEETARNDSVHFDDASFPFLTPHPTIGPVDHISVMPLIQLDAKPKQSTLNTNTNNKNKNKNKNKNNNNNNTPAAARAARSIITELRQRLGDSYTIWEYGTVTESNVSLADVRRTRTQFFQQQRRRQDPMGTITDQNSSPVMSAKSDGIVLALTTPSRTDSTDAAATAATVGAPECFVENYNIRLSNGVPVQQARALTRLIRSSVPHVEALTLPYLHGSCEIACNLLRPDSFNKKEIDAVIEQFIRTNNEKLSDIEQDSQWIETAYRVGTTAQQCIEALESVIASKESRIEHDRRVAQHF